MNKLWLLLSFLLFPLLTLAQPTPPNNLRIENVPFSEVPRPPQDMKVGQITGMSISPPGYPNRVYLAGWTVPQAIAVILYINDAPLAAVPVTLTDPPVAGTFIWVIPEDLQDGVERTVSGYVQSATTSKPIGSLDKPFKLKIPK